MFDYYYKYCKYKIKYLQLLKLITIRENNKYIIQKDTTTNKLIYKQTTEKIIVFDNIEHYSSDIMICPICQKHTLKMSKGISHPIIDLPYTNQYICSWCYFD
jgi:hypothetical protein